MRKLINATVVGLAVIVSGSSATIAGASKIEDAITRHAATLHWNEACGGNERPDPVASRRIQTTKGAAGLLNGHVQVMRALSSTPEDREMFCSRLARKFGFKSSRSPR